MNKYELQLYLFIYCLKFYVTDLGLSKYLFQKRQDNAAATKIVQIIVPCLLDKGALFRLICLPQKSTGQGNGQNKVLLTMDDQ